MKNFYSAILEEVQSTIKKAGDEQLHSELYKDTLLEKFKVTPPELDSGRLAVEIKSKTITASNAPEGFEFNPGDMVNYALYSIPVRGAVNILQEKAATLFKKSNKFSLVEGHLFIEEYSFEKIENNEEVIASVKAAMLRDLSFIEKLIHETQQEVRAFDSKLQEEIKIAIAAELEKRRKYAETLNLLNPFDSVSERKII